jgi:hypothetical protein
MIRALAIDSTICLTLTMTLSQRGDGSRYSRVPSAAGTGRTSARLRSCLREPGVNVSELARRPEINPQQLFGWRSRLRADAEAMIAAARSPEPTRFAPILVEGPSGA